MYIELPVEAALASEDATMQSIPTRLRLFGVAVLIGICVAGFWNARVRTRGLETSRRPRNCTR